MATSRFEHLWKQRHLFSIRNTSFEIGHHVEEIRSKIDNCKFTFLGLSLRWWLLLFNCITEVVGWSFHSWMYKVRSLLFRLRGLLYFDLAYHTLVVESVWTNLFKFWLDVLYAFEFLDDNGLNGATCIVTRLLNFGCHLITVSIHWGGVWTRGLTFQI